MSKKEAFIELVQKEIFDREDIYVENYPDTFSDAKTYFEALKGSADKERPAFTQNGKLVLKYMQENKDLYNNLFTAKSLGEGIGISSRTASGACRKLVTDGHLERLGENPVSYSLTDKGVNVDIDAQ